MAFLPHRAPAPPGGRLPLWFSPWLGWFVAGGFGGGDLYRRRAERFLALGAVRSVSSFGAGNFCFAKGRPGQARRLPVFAGAFAARSGTCAD